MSVKVKRLIIIYTAAALVTLSVLSAVCYSRVEDYRLAADYSSASAFDTAVSAVEGLSLSLRKLEYVSDDSLGRSLCSHAYADALSAQAALSVLPFDTAELESVSAFLNTAGDYTGSLCAMSADELTERQRDELKRLSDSARDFTETLRTMQSDVNSGALMMDTREKLLRNIGIEDNELLSARLLGYEADFSAPDGLEYDGRYTAAEEAEQDGGVSESEAKALAAKAAGVEERELMEEYAYEGTDGRRCYSAGGMLICVSDRGLESLSRSRLTGESRTDAPAARKAAEDFLNKLGYKGLKLYSEDIGDTLARFLYTPTQDGVSRVDDGISISVALDDGSIYSFDATKYSGEDAELEWKTGSEDAENALPEGISVGSVKQVIRKSPGGKYIPCHVLECSNENGETASVYVSAETGRQWDVVLG